MIGETREDALARAFAAFEARELKATWALDQGRPGFSDRDNFTTNRVTLAEFDDGRAYGAAAATGLSTTYACVTLIAGTIGSLPPSPMRPGAGGVSVEDRRHPLFELLHESPNADQSAVDFWDYMSSAVELAGNAYAVIERNPGGDRIISLTPTGCSPSDVKAERRDYGRIWYRWNEDGRSREAPQENMLHLRGPGGTMLGGASPLAMCRSSFNAAVSAQRAAGAVFHNGVRPSGVLSTERKFTGTDRADLEQVMQEKFVGSLNAGHPMLLDGGLKWETLSINPNDAQMLETRKFSVEEICRIFGVPPHMIGHMEKASAFPGGIEQQTIAFLVYTMRRRIKRIEAAIKKQLLTPRDRAEGVSVKFDMRELMRADSKGRAEYYKTMSEIKALTINEVRAEENLPPVPWGNAPWGQMQDVQLTGDGRLPPPASA